MRRSQQIRMVMALCAVTLALPVQAQSDSTWPGSRLCYGDASMMLQPDVAVLVHRFTLDDVRDALVPTPAEIASGGGPLGKAYAGARASCRKLAAQVAARMGRSGAGLIVQAVIASDSVAGLDSALNAVGAAPVVLLDSVAAHAAAATMRARALGALVTIGTPANGAVSSIVAGLSDTVPAVRIAAARAAYSALPGDPRLLDGLMSMLQSAQSDSTRIAALAAIGRYNSHTAERAQNVVVHLLATGDSAVRPMALQALDGNKEVQMRAATDPELPGIGATSVDPALIAALFGRAGDDWYMEMGLADLLTTVRPFPVSTFECLIARPGRVRTASLFALEGAGREALPLVPALLRVLSDSAARQVAGRTLATLLPELAPPDLIAVRPTLMALLDSPVTDVSQTVAPAVVRSLSVDSALSLMGRRMLRDPQHDRTGVIGMSVIGAPAVPLLITAARNASPVVRAHAMDALGDIGEVTTIPVLIAGLDDPAQRVRLLAAINLALFRQKAASALSALRAHVRDPDGEVRAAVIDAIRAASPQ